ncbi:MAG: stage V sporulation protein S [Caldilineaceae bacterium]|nr:stage V sporulation protein S [Caldilineaceae bacterium]
MNKIIRVASYSHPAAVAGAIAALIRQEGSVYVQAIGAGAVNQMMKATVLARRYLLDDECPVVLVPETIDVLVNENRRTAIRLTVQVRM